MTQRTVDGGNKEREVGTGQTPQKRYFDMRVKNLDSEQRMTSMLYVC